MYYWKPNSNGRIQILSTEDSTNSVRSASSEFRTGKYFHALVSYSTSHGEHIAVSSIAGKCRYLHAGAVFYVQYRRAFLTFSHFCQLFLGFALGEECTLREIRGVPAVFSARLLAHFLALFGGRWSGRPVEIHHMVSNSKKYADRNITTTPVQ